ncbi:MULTISPECIES: hypothetical protein [Pseudomonas]|uniref:hypothetical protein n=1 Tax=Pseudomonas TaxID=286 RepID=UPI00093AA7C1|nr:MULTISPECIES: hypothetical protein [Pseudomonas]EMA2592512.1 hypothetical protein [Pseudomonas aeruginosa]MBD9427989.1 hypothetical protein [Pseudomonas sp. PDM15]
MSRKTVSALIVLAIFQSLAMSTWAGELVVHDAVVVTDGSTRLVNCQNTRGLFVLNRALAPADAYVVNADVRNSSLSDALARILPAGWAVRYSSPNVENEQINLVVQTYWADALKILASDYNLFVIVDGEREEVVIGRL